MIPVHNHSHFSALDGASTPDEIAERIEALGLPGAFLTDHGLVAGHRPFAEAMAARGLYAGFGLEAYQAKVSRKTTPEAEPYVDKNGRQRTKKPRDAAHLILLAKNSEGLRNLNILSDESNRTGFYYAPRLDWELLEKHNEGIIATSACLSGLVSRGIEGGTTEYLHKYMEIFRDRFYIELHTYAAEKQRAINVELISLAKTYGIPLVYANDAHYACGEDHFLHEMILCMQMANDYHSPKNLSPDGEVDENHSHDGQDNHYHPKSLYIMGETAVREELSYLPDAAVNEAIANSDLIASMCQVRLPDTRMHMPSFKAPDNLKVEFPEDNQLVLLELMERGLTERYGDPLPQEVIDRAEAEYEILTAVDLGTGATLGDYFLLNWDWINNFCRSEGILTGPGRGSSGGSILAYALGITHIDPIKYNLQFERFWNAGRTKGFPDIDTDVEKRHRSTVKQYLIDKYGGDKVLSIGTHIKHKPKSAIESAAKAWFGREVMKEQGHYRTVDEIKAIIEKTVDAGQQPDWPEIWEMVGAELRPYKNKSKDWETIFDVAERITDRISTYGVHASAVVVSDVTLPEVLPCRSAKADSTGERQLVTQIDMHDVEAEGFLKLDLLGLRNLDTLAVTAELLDKRGFDWWTEVDFENLPDSCWELLDKGLTLGLFQIEEGYAARDIAKRLQPRNLEDLAAIVALNRPGPLRSGMVDKFLARRAGDEEVEFKHPILEEILAPTYGFFLYQEQVIAYFRKLGYSLSDADHIRKIIGKKLREEMQAEHPRYLEYAARHMDEETAEAIWNEIQDFSKYAFNKPHAVCYGMILAATMYAKGT